jgi:hypothetical protein
MADRFELLADSRTCGRTLFALKRVAEALEAGLLTLEEVKRAADRISPHHRGLFDVEPEQAAQRAVQVIHAIERTLQTRFPARFRAGQRQ